ncbi:MAG TPA: EAL domain-containing protein [Nevskiaceae bacterium]|nr:EAL domain-containing protein [Nevskiaceae bacterium]
MQRADGCAPKATPAPALCAYFQRKVQCRDERTCGYEALLRVVRPDSEAGDPATFLSGLLALHGPEREVRHVALFDYMLQRARAVHAACGLPVSVNAPPFLLENAAWVDRMTGDNGDGVTVEILEKVRIDSYAAVNEAIDRLHAAGYGIAMDDFGSAYATGARLLRLRGLDEVKVDRNVIAEAALGHTDTLADAVDAIHATGATATAEGVETMGQRTLCFAAGVDEIQGFLYGKPQPWPWNGQAEAELAVVQTPWEQAQARRARPAA